uniref:Uncharacterized protein n=1 Tax=Arundo donax TaxID=35708 RepID=A0A0A9PVB1_ARUDO
MPSCSPSLKSRSPGTSVYTPSSCARSRQRNARGGISTAAAGFGEGTEETAALRWNWWR